MNKRTLQEIFDAVIDAEHYPYKEQNYHSSSFMCSALNYAKLMDTITEKEMQRALESIKDYMKKLSPEVAKHDPALYEVWQHVGIIDNNTPLREAQVKLLTCYKYWTNRPYPHHKLNGKKV